MGCAAISHVHRVTSLLLLPQVQFDDIFSLRRPRDARAGLSSGLKSIAKGVVGGVAGLVAAPVIGATQQGVTGFAKGVATGGHAPMHAGNRMCGEASVQSLNCCAAP